MTVILLDIAIQGCLLCLSLATSLPKGTFPYGRFRVTEKIQQVPMLKAFPCGPVMGCGLWVVRCGFWEIPIEITRGFAAGHKNSDFPSLVIAGLRPEVCKHEKADTKRPITRHPQTIHMERCPNSVRILWIVTKIDNPGAWHGIWFLLVSSLGSFPLKVCLYYVLRERVSEQRKITSSISHEGVQICMMPVNDLRARASNNSYRLLACLNMNRP